MQPVREHLVEPSDDEKGIVSNMFRLHATDHELWGLADVMESEFWSDPSRAHRTCLLAHCVSAGAASVKQILDHGFSLAFGGSAGGTVFGTGVYFTDAISKAIHYSRDNIALVLLCVVDLGNCVYVTAGHTSYANHPHIKEWTRSHPPKPSDDMVQAGIAKWNSWHGEVGDNEFIVYHINRIMPLYLLAIDKSSCSNVRNVVQRRSPDFVVGLPKHRSPIPSSAWGHMFSVRLAKHFAEARREEAAEALRASELDEEDRSSSSIPKTLGLSADPGGECCLGDLCPHGSKSTVWKLGCGHSACEECIGQMGKSGTNMTGEGVAGIKCPACTAVTGTVMGTCPDGVMTAKKSRDQCSIEFVLSIKGGVCPETNQRYYARTQFAYLDSDCAFLLPLFRYMWNHRFLMRLGASNTNHGAFGVCFGDVHLRTLMAYGVSPGNKPPFSLPDPGYPKSFIEECAAKIGRDKVISILPEAVDYLPEPPAKQTPVSDQPSALPAPCPAAGPPPSPASNGNGNGNGKAALPASPPISLLSDSDSDSDSDSENVCLAVRKKIKLSGSSGKTSAP